MRVKTRQRMKVVRGASVVSLFLGVSGMLGVLRPAQAGQTTAIPCPAKAKAVIANTGQSIHDAGSAVTGDVQAGQMIVHNGGTISGSQLPNTPAGFAVVPVPAGATNLGNVTITGTRNFTAGNYVASTFQMNAGSSVTVSGGIVQIWVTGGLVLFGQVNNGGNPQNLEFLVTGTQDAHVNSNTNLFGFIYAPAAAVLVDSVVHGSVVGSRTTINSNGRVIFDAGSTCTTTTPPGSCQSTSSLTVLVTNTNVSAYVPNGDWGNATTGVQLVPIEGTVSRATIATPNAVNSCGANSATGLTVCTANTNDVYLINGSTLTTTLHSGAIQAQTFSGGQCLNCGVAIDAVHNTAAIAVGLSSSPNLGGFQFLNLATNVFAPVVAAGRATSEDILIDPVRNLLLSPEEALVAPGTTNDYQLMNTTTNAVFDFVSPPGVSTSGLFDSAAEDCSTGIALSSVEGTGQIFMTDLTQAAFAGTNWSAPSSAQTFVEFQSPMLSDGTNGIAVAPGSSHLGVVAGEFGGTGFGAFLLPATSGTGSPAMVDWVAANLPPVPGGTAWAMGNDPHTVTAYVSPASNKAFAVMANSQRTFLAVVDLQALLAATRNNPHTTVVDLLATNIVKYISIH